MGQLAVKLLADDGYWECEARQVVEVVSSSDGLSGHGGLKERPRVTFPRSCTRRLQRKSTTSCRRHDVFGTRVRLSFVCL